jgi:hypothetical protein
MKAMRYMLLNLEWDESDSPGGPANAAIVTLSDDYMRELQERQAKLKELQHYMPKLVELVFFDSAVTFYEFNLDGMLTAPEYDAFWDDRYLELRPEVVLWMEQAEAKERSAVRTNGDCVSVLTTGFYWTASDHYSGRYRTWGPSNNQLIKLFESQPPTLRKVE